MDAGHCDGCRRGFRPGTGPVFGPHRHRQHLEGGRADSAARLWPLRFAQSLRSLPDGGIPHAGAGHRVCGLRFPASHAHRSRLRGGQPQPGFAGPGARRLFHRPSRGAPYGTARRAVARQRGPRRGVERRRAVRLAVGRPPHCPGFLRRRRWAKRPGVERGLPGEHWSDLFRHSERASAGRARVRPDAVSARGKRTTRWSGLPATCKPGSCPRSQCLPCSCRLRPGRSARTRRKASPCWYAALRAATLWQPCGPNWHPSIPI